MFSRTLRIAAILLLASFIVSCLGVAPPAPGPLPASPSPANPDDLAALPASPSPTDAGEPATIAKDPVPVEPVLIFSQPPNPDGGLIPSSLRVPDGSGTDQWAWESFTFDTIQTITELRWRGAYDPAKTRLRRSGARLYD